MPKYHIPKGVGDLEIIESKSGSPIVWNRQKGKRKVMIPCRDIPHAEEVISKIRDIKGGGELWV